MAAHPIEGAPDTPALLRRSRLRLLATLPVIRDVDDLDVLAQLAADYLANPELPTTVVADLLADRADEPPIESLQHAARLLDDGRDHESVARLTGLTLCDVRHVASSVSVVHYRAAVDLELGRLAARTGAPPGRPIAGTGRLPSQPANSLLAVAIRTSLTDRWPSPWTTS